MKVVASWSGGKESCLSCYQAIRDGFEVTHLLNFVSKENKCMSHGLDAGLINLQSEAMEIPMIQWQTSWKTYGQQIKAALREMKENGINGVVFGDIHEIPGHEGWVDRVCAEIGLASIKPLWGLEPRTVLASFLDEGFKATLVMVKADILGEEWLGREIDEDFENDLLKLKRSVNLSGELGEYHTFVTNGPLFKKRIKIMESGKKLKNGFWYLDITRSELRKKETIRNE